MLNMEVLYQFIALRQFGTDTEIVKSVLEGEETQCAVCLDCVNIGDKEATLRCGHRFHGHCLLHWLMEGGRSCPICREHIKEKEGEVTTQNWAVCAVGL